MKEILNKLTKNEGGQALIIVLILLVIGGLIIGPLLGFMSTGLMAGQTYEERMDEVYAADAGIEDAVWKIMNSELPETPYYDLPELVNGKQVRVTPPSGDDEEITFFINLGVLKDTQGNYNKNRPHQDWLVVYAPLVDEEGMCYEYRITAFYVGGGQPQILSTGFWIYEYNESLYEPGTATVELWEAQDNNLRIDLNGDGFYTLYDIDGDGVDDVDEASIITEPLIDPGYTNYEYREVNYLGRAFIWEWKPAKGPKFGKGVICRTQRFALDPEIPVDEFPPNVAWLGTKENSIQISWFGDITGMDAIIAEAFSAPDKSTRVTSYVFTEEVPGEPVAVTILTWDISLQQE